MHVELNIYVVTLQGKLKILKRPELFKATHKTAPISLSVTKQQKPVIN
jgi:hypothetical protein